MARHGRTFPIRPHMNYQGRTGIYFNRQLSTTLTDAVTLVDSVVKNTTLRSLVETITLVDVITSTKVQVREFVESITLVDTLYKFQAKVLTEAVTLVDTITKSFAAFRTLTESVTLVDTVLKLQSRVLRESVTLVDLIIKRITNYVIRLPFHKGYRNNDPDQEGTRLDG